MSLRNRHLALFLCVCAAWLGTVAHAQVVRCTDTRTGKVTYTDGACTGGAAAREVEARKTPEELQLEREQAAEALERKQQLPQPHNRRTTPAPRNVHVRGAISTWWLQACRARPMSRNCGSKRPRGRWTWTAWAPRAMPRSKRHEPTSRGWSWSHPPGTALSTPIHFPRQVPHNPHHASPNVATFAAPTTWATPTHAQVRGGFPGPVGSAAQTAARRPADATGAQQQALTLRLPAQPLGHAGVAQPQPQFPHHALVVEPA